MIQLLWSQLFLLYYEITDFFFQNLRKKLIFYWLFPYILNIYLVV